MHTRLICRTTHHKNTMWTKAACGTYIHAVRVTSHKEHKNAANRKSKSNDLRSIWLWSDKVQPYSTCSIKCFNTLIHIIVGETFLKACDRASECMVSETLNLYLHTKCHWSADIGLGVARATTPSSASSDNDPSKKTFQVSKLWYPCRLHTACQCHNSHW